MCLKSFFVGASTSRHRGISRWSFVGLLLLICMLAIYGPASAVQLDSMGPKVSVSGHAGDTVNLPVYLTVSHSVESANFTITITPDGSAPAITDPNSLTLVSYVATYSGAAPTLTHPTASSFTVSWSTDGFATPQYGDFILATVGVKIPGTVAHGASYTVSMGTPQVGDYTGGTPAWTWTTILAKSNVKIRVPSVLTMAVNPADGGTTVPVAGNTSEQLEGASVNISATPAAHFTFTNWTATGGAALGNASNSSTTVTMAAADSTVTANFAPITHNLTVEADAGGSTDPNGTSSQNEGADVSISATPDGGYKFVNWTSTGSVSVNDPNSASTTVHINGAGTVTAHFAALANYTLTVNGPKSCKVSVGGTEHTLPWSTTYPEDTVVSITAIEPSEDWLFENWSGSVSSANNPLSITMDGDKTISANYLVAFDLAASGTGTGSVDVGETSVTEFPYSDGFPYNTSLTLQAVPDAGSQFVGWFNDADVLVSTGNPKTWKLNAPLSLSAKFEPAPASRTSGSGTYKAGGIRFNVAVDVRRLTVGGALSGSLSWYNSRTRQKFTANTATLTEMVVLGNVATITGTGILTGNGAGTYDFTLVVTDGSPDNWSITIDSPTPISSAGNLTSGRLSVLIVP